MRTWPFVVGMMLFLAAMIAVPVLRLSSWWFVVAVVFPIANMWAWWCVAVTGWRIWAYERVRNVHELITIARQEELIPAEGSWLERTEWRTRADQERLAALAVRFNTPDEFSDDHMIGERTEILYSATKAWTGIVGSMFMFALATYIVVNALPKDRSVWWVPVLCVALGAVVMVRQITRLMDRRPVIILDENGIELRGGGFHLWSAINMEQVVRVRRGKNGFDELSFRTPQGVVAFRIDPLRTNKDELRHLMSVYRGRCEQRAPGVNK